MFFQGKWMEKCNSFHRDQSLTDRRASCRETQAAGHETYGAFPRENYGLLRTQKKSIKGYSASSIKSPTPLQASALGGPREIPALRGVLYALYMWLHGALLCSISVPNPTQHLDADHFSSRPDRGRMREQLRAPLLYRHARAPLFTHTDTSLPSFGREARAVSARQH